MFPEFDVVALGSASIAQVHKAKLADGTAVAVKVRRPGVVETVTEDLAIMERVAELYSLVKGEGGQISLQDLVSEMVKTSTLELDFLNEADSIERFAANCEGRTHMTCPKCYRELCTSAILVEGLVESPSVEHLEEVDAQEVDRKTLAYGIAHNYMQQIMEDGFFHADPHAGNIAVGSDGTITWMDFGMMGEITKSQRAVLKEAVSALGREDSYSLKRAMLKMAVPTKHVDQSDLLVLCDDLVDRFIDTDLESFDTGALMEAVVSGLQGRGLKVEPYLSNLSRGLVTLEGTINLICPQLNIMNVVRDYIVSTFSIEEGARKARRLAGWSIEGAEALADLPAKAVDTLDMVQKGQVRLQLDLPLTKSLDKEIRGVGAVLALSFIAAAIVVGACILGASGRGLYIGGVSLEGSFGLILGAAMLVFVFVKSWKYLK
ncbi:ABC1 kinase family protein [Curtanaerobium respiraculi]|uniref:ABC1 kinase family protein n=1 Tax=Curtanaerobium respiraculi TaxID=2949669 RepID=UPI0024B37D0B|nr:AarF/UbiB family protein [Curtanaerobium respiraculi]